MRDRANSNSRRDFLKSTLIAISTVTLSSEAPPVLASAHKGATAERFLNDSEKRFLESVVDRLIPTDEHWPGAAEAGVVTTPPRSRPMRSCKQNSRRPSGE